MNRIALSPALRSLALAGAAAFSLTSLTACMTSSDDPIESADSDGQAAYLTSEVDQMGQVYDQIGEALAKSSVPAVTITGELVIEPFAYQEECQCFVRHATYTGMHGYERDRLDSVRLFDSAGAAMDKFRPARIAKIIHSRNVTKAKDGREADIRIDIVAEFKTEAGVRKGVWNGTMTGSYNGNEFKSGTVENVVRTWDGGHFAFPEDGVIEVDRPVFNYRIEFLGDGKAKVIIRNKATKKERILFVDSDYRETEEAP